MKRGELLKQSKFFDCFADINVDDDGGFLLSVWHMDWACGNSVQSNHATLAEAEEALQSVRRREFIYALRDLTFSLNELGYEYCEERRNIEQRWNSLVSQKAEYGVSADDVRAVKDYVVRGRTNVLAV